MYILYHLIIIVLCSILTRLVILLDLIIEISMTHLTYVLVFFFIIIMIT